MCGYVGFVDKIDSKDQVLTRNDESNHSQRSR